MSGENNFKVIFVPELGSDGQFEQEFETQQEAETALNAIANYQLFLDDCGITLGYSNIGMVCKLDEYGDWVEIDADGEEM